MQPMPSRARTFCTLGTLCSLILAACGGGSSNNNTPSVPTTTVVAQLSADQAAFESMVLAPNAVYLLHDTNLPATGAAIQNSYVTDYKAELTKSPLTNGVQRVVMGDFAPVANNKIVPGYLEPAWLVLNGGFKKKASPYVFDYSYANGVISFDALDSDQTIAVESYEISNVSAAKLSGIVTAAPSDFKTPFDKLFTNASLLKSTVNWQDSAAYLKYTITSSKDSYRVYASNGVPHVVNAKSTLDAQLASGGLSDGTNKYTANDGTISVINGLRTYVAKNSFTIATSIRYRTFYELNGDVYMGDLVKAGAQGNVIGYNTPARTSLQAALTF